MVVVRKEPHAMEEVTTPSPAATAGRQVFLPLQQATMDTSRAAMPWHVLSARVIAGEDATDGEPPRGSAVLFVCASCAPFRGRKRIESGVGEHALAGLPVFGRDVEPAYYRIQ